MKKQKAAAGRTTSTYTEKADDKAPKKTAPVPDNALTRLVKGKATKSSATATAPTRDHVSLVAFCFITMMSTRVAPEPMLGWRQANVGFDEVFGSSWSLTYFLFESAYLHRVGCNGEVC